MRRLLPVLALTLVALACSDGGGLAGELDGRTFVSTEVTGEVAYDTVIRVAFAGDAVTVDSGCSSESSAYEVADGHMVVATRFQQLETCLTDLGAVHQDAWVAQFVMGDPRVALAGDRLTLRGDGVTIELVEDTGEAAALENRRFHVAHVRGVEARPRGTELTIDFGRDTFGFTDGCALASGDYVVTGGRLRPGLLDVTFPGCERSPGAWLEGFLEAEPAVRVDGDELRLSGGGIEVVAVDEAG